MEKLGIEGTQLLVQVVDFVIIAAVLTKVLYKPILKVLDERKRKIEQGLALTEELKAERDKLDKERRQILKAAEEEAKKIVDGAIIEARGKAKTIEDEEKAKIRRELEKMHEELAQEREKIMDEATKRALQVSVAIAEKIIGKELSAKDERAYFERAIKSLQKSESV